MKRKSTKMCPELYKPKIVVYENPDLAYKTKFCGLSNLLIPTEKSKQTKKKKGFYLYEIT